MGRTTENWEALLIFEREEGRLKAIIRYHLGDTKDEHRMELSAYRRWLHTAERTSWFQDFVEHNNIDPAALEEFRLQIGGRRVLGK